MKFVQRLLSLWPTSFLTSSVYGYPPVAYGSPDYIMHIHVNIFQTALVAGSKSFSI